MKRTKPFIVINKRYYLGHIVDILLTVKGQNYYLDKDFIVFQTDTKEG